MTNAAGRLADQGFGSSIEVTRTMKVACLDTALVYGDAERRIGVLATGFDAQTQ